MVNDHTLVSDEIFPVLNKRRTTNIFQTSPTYRTDISADSTHSGKLGPALLVTYELHGVDFVRHQDDWYSKILGYFTKLLTFEDNVF